MELITQPSKVLIGCDPEVILRRDGSIVSAIDLIGGTKEEPRQFARGTLQEDNIMAEIGTNPTDSAMEFIVSLESMMNELRELTGADLWITPSARVPFEILNRNPNRAFLFGCEPDYNAYTGKQNPNPSSKSNLRTCAGHIHLGFEHKDGSEEGIQNLVKYLDFSVGLWTVLKDDDRLRRTKYGKAGAFRYKPYGVEYRVPSNFWLASKELQAEIFHRSQLGYALAQKGFELPPEKEVVVAINSSNKSLAQELLGDYSCQVTNDSLKVA